MFNIIGLYVEINRGNVAGLTFHFEGDDVPIDGTEVLFRVSRIEDKEDCLIEKRIAVEDGMINVDFLPEDTETIEPGLYCWNACIQYYDGTEPWTILRDWQQFHILA